MGKWAKAEEDYLLARHLFPVNREIYALAMGVSVVQGMKLFHISEDRSLCNMAHWILAEHGFCYPVYST